VSESNVDVSGRVVTTDPTASDHLPVAATLRLTGSWVG
jgi:endonuclease/exonuclease/phosphatase family metal-dependent hydrolase